jgi:hypothetical protein
MKFCLPICPSAFDEGADDDATGDRPDDTVPVLEADV